RVDSPTHFSLSSGQTFRKGQRREGSEASAAGRADGNRPGPTSAPLRHCSRIPASPHRGSPLGGRGATPPASEFHPVPNRQDTYLPDRFPFPGARPPARGGGTAASALAGLTGAGGLVNPRHKKGH